MLSEKESKRISKFLSYVLRHHPELIGIRLDEKGWTAVAVLLEKTNAFGIQLNAETLKHIVATNNKKRFAFNENFELIRASQGHSVNIELGYLPQEPPAILYHGTALKNAESILKNGIHKQERQHVHLSATIQTAIEVGQRHGKPKVFTVLSHQMHNDQYKFFLSENNVWLTEFVPAKYLQEPEV